MDGNAPTEQTAAANVRERIKAMVVALIFIAAGIGMWVWHDVYISDLIRIATGGEATHHFRAKLDWIWCRPTGVIAMVVGVVTLYGALTKRAPNRIALPL